MLCLIKQDGALILSWFIGPTLESVALPCADDALMAELMADPMRYTVVRMAAMVVRRGWVGPSERINPCPRTDPGLTAI